MLLYGSSSLFLSPKKWLRGIALVKSDARPGWSRLQVQEQPPLYASMTPGGTWQDPSPNDGPYEQCLQRGPNLVFMPRESGEDQVVPAVFDL